MFNMNPLHSRGKLNGMEAMMQQSHYLTYDIIIPSLERGMPLSTILAQNNIILNLHLMDYDIAVIKKILDR